MRILIYFTRKIATTTKHRDEDQNVRFSTNFSASGRKQSITSTRGTPPSLEFNVLGAESIRTYAFLPRNTELDKQLNFYFDVHCGS